MIRFQDDFYDAVNGEWASTAVIPDDKPRTGGFSDLADEIEELMLDKSDAWLAGKDLPSDAILANFVKFIQCNRKSLFHISRNCLTSVLSVQFATTAYKLLFEDFTFQLSFRIAFGLLVSSKFNDFLSSFISNKYLLINKKYLFKI